MRLLLGWLAVGLVVVPLASAAAPVAQLGAAGFEPSPDRPVGWRGDGSGRFPGATPVTQWSATKNVRWGVAVGRGYSSPVVTDALAFVTAEPNLLVCVNRADGKVRWAVAVTPAELTDEKHRQLAEAYEPPKDGSGMAAATPVTDGKCVYAVFANGIVRAVELDGKAKWTSFIDAAQSTGYGRSASPIFVDGKLIVHMTHLYAFHPADGKQLWVNRQAKSSYGTPVGMKVGDAEVIVTPGGDVVRAADGKGLNRDIGRTTHSSPVVIGDGVVCFGDAGVSAIRLNAVFKEEEAWSGMVSGEVFGSPLLHDGTVFVATGAGELFTFDATGKGADEPPAEPRKLFEDAGGATPAAYASLTLAGKYLFLNSNKGEVVVLEANRAAKLVARNRLPAGSGSSPVFSGKDMFLRDGDRLYCIGE